MRVLIAGATGVIGRQLVPLLTATGHDVIALSREPGAGPAAAGVETVSADALDAERLREAVVAAAPDAVVHLLTAIPKNVNPRRIRRDFAATNRLRTEGTANLITAAQAAGVKRFIAQGLAYVYDPDGRADGPANEDAAWWNDPPRQFADVKDALAELEKRTTEAGGLLLRFGHLYGPGTIFDTEGSMTRQIRAGRVPIVGEGGAVFSFTHTHDAATAIVSALSRDVGGALNVVDDDPVPARVWLPVAARLLGAAEPRRVPVLMARMAVGGWGVAFMTRLRGADNARARLALNWRPRYTGWRTGLAEEWRSAA